MATFVIIYGTQHNHTYKIAGYLADTIRAQGHSVDLMPGRVKLSRAELERYDGVIIGASVNAAKHQRYIEKFVKAHRDQLERSSAAFFSVSLHAARQKVENRAEVERYLAKFSGRTGWQPRRIATFGGALFYTRYDLLNRFILRLIAKRAGLDTDTRSDYIYTDWDAVKQFGVELAAMTS